MRENQERYMQLITVLEHKVVNCNKPQHYKFENQSLRYAYSQFVNREFYEIARYTSHIKGRFS